MAVKQTILITGGAGFLGSHLSDAYLALDYQVIAVDNLSTGSKKNIAHLAYNSCFRFIEHDICQPLPPEILDQKIDIVANFASPASPPHYQNLALETLDVGSNGVRHMLDLARNNQARFFQASTSEVYGDPQVHPQPESYKGSVNCYGPRSMYDEAKRYAEALIYVYKHKYGVNTCIARFFNTYGPRMDANDGRVVSNFIVQALEGKPLTVYGKGSQTRSFCYVDDLIKGIMLLINSSHSDPMNLGNPAEFTVNQLAEKVNQLTNNKTTIKYLPLPADDPTQRKPVISLAEKVLNWSPEVDLIDGLKNTITYFEADLYKNTDVT